MTKPDNCPCCGQLIIPEDAADCLTPRQAQIFNLIRARMPHGILRSRLMGLVYADDIDGGPDTFKVIDVLICYANKRLAKKGLRIASKHTGNGAEYPTRIVAL